MMNVIKLGLFSISTFSGAQGISAENLHVIQEIPIGNRYTLKGHYFIEMAKKAKIYYENIINVYSFIFTLIETLGPKSHSMYSCHPNNRVNGLKCKIALSKESCLVGVTELIAYLHTFLDSESKSPNNQFYRWWKIKFLNTLLILRKQEDALPGYTNNV